MDAFLEELETGGALDSSGEFTVDLNKARLKLAEYQLTRFEMFVDFLISAATVGGVEAFEVTVARKRKGDLTTFYLRGWALNESDIRELDPLAQGGNRALRYLAVALTTLGSRYPLVLKSRGQSGPVLALVLNRGEVKAGSSVDPAYPLDLTTVRVPVDLGLEIVNLSKFRAWASFRLSINKLQLETGPSALGIKREPLGILHEDDLYLVLTEPDEAMRIGLFFLIDGMPYRVLPEASERGVCGYVKADELRRDLSYTGLLEDDLFRSRVISTMEQFGRLIMETLEGKRVTVSQELALQRLLSYLEKEIPVETLWRTLESANPNLRPHITALAFKVLLKRIPSVSVEDQNQLLTDYDQYFFAFRRDGERLKAEQYLACKMQCLKLLRRNPEKERLLTFLLAMVRGERCDAPPNLPLYGDYLRGVSRWVQDGSIPSLHDLPPEIDRSWCLPFHSIDTEGEHNWSLAFEYCAGKAPPWVVMGATLALKRFPEALKLLSSEPALDFSSAQVHWYSLLWEHHRGRMPWKLAVKVRVLYSQAILEQSGLPALRALRRSLNAPSLFPAATLNTQEYVKERTRFLDQEYFAQRFWPEFFYFFDKRQTKGDRSKKLWQMLIGQSLLGLVGSSPEEHPLSLAIFSDRSSFSTNRHPRVTSRKPGH